MVRAWSSLCAAGGLLAALLVGVASAPASASVTPRTWFVAQSGTASFGSGTSCSAPDAVGADDTAIRTVLDAVTIDDTITICDGVYSITQTLLIDDSIAIQGQSTAGSILDGGNAVQIMRVKDDSVLTASAGEVHLLLTDLTLRNGNTGNNGTDRCNTQSQCGGAIYVESQSDLTVRRAYFEGNRSSFIGGAIGNSGIEGIWAGGNVRVEDSTFYGNVSRIDGGAIGIGANFSPGLTVVNSTFVGNTAQVRHGGAISESFSGGSITSSTFVDNVGPDGNAIRGSYTIRGSLVAGRTGSLCGSGTTNLNSTNVVTASGCGTATVVTYDSLNLRGLGNWGGPTQTVWIGPGSTAVDANTGTCQALDQRGAARSASPCDAGAFERQGPSDEATTGTLDYPATVDVGFAALPMSSPSFSGSGRTLGYMSLSSSTCSVDSNSGAATGVTAGACEVQWYLAPTLLLDGAAQDDSLVVQRGTQEPLMITSGTGPLVFGEWMNLTTSGGSGTGSVIFDTGSSTGCFVYWWDPSTLYVSDPEGTCTITATKLADSSYEATTSAPMTVTLLKASQETLEVVAPNYLSLGSGVALTTTGGSGSGDVSYSVTPPAVCMIESGALRATGYGVCRVTASKAGDFGYLPATSAPVSVEVTSPEPPDPTKAPSPPRDAVARVTDSGVSVAWKEPATSGAFPVSTYQVTSRPAGGSCLVSAPALACEVTGLEPGRAYTFTVRALNGSGWGRYSEPSNSVDTPRQPDPAIVITGTREGRLIVVKGEVSGMADGADLSVWVHLGQRADFAVASRSPSVEAGAFQWQRRTAKAVEVYVSTSDGAYRSNSVRIARMSDVKRNQIPINGR
jgi:hypothetical protein